MSTEDYTNSEPTIKTLDPISHDSSGGGVSAKKSYGHIIFGAGVGLVTVVAALAAYFFILDSSSNVVRVAAFAAGLVMMSAGYATLIGLNKFSEGSVSRPAFVASVLVFTGGLFGLSGPLGIDEKIAFNDCLREAEQNLDLQIDDNVEAIKNNNGILAETKTHAVLDELIDLKVAGECSDIESSLGTMPAPVMDNKKPKVDASLDFRIPANGSAIMREVTPSKMPFIITN